MKNIGKGVARDITLWYKLQKKNEETKEEKWVVPFLLPNNSAKIVLFENKPYIQFLKEYDKFIFKRRYYSDEECIKDIEIEQDLKKILELGKLEITPLENSLEENINDISKSLKEMAKKLKK